MIYSIVNRGLGIKKVDGLVVQNFTAKIQDYFIFKITPYIYAQKSEKSDM